MLLRLSLLCESNRLRLIVIALFAIIIITNENASAPIKFHSFLFVSDHIRDFSCGKLYYRTFYLDAKKDALYVGAM